MCKGSSRTWRGKKREKGKGNRWDKKSLDWEEGKRGKRVDKEHSENWTSVGRVFERITATLIPRSPWLRINPR